MEVIGFCAEKEAANDEGKPDPARNLHYWNCSCPAHGPVGRHRHPVNSEHRPQEGLLRTGREQIKRCKGMYSRTVDIEAEAGN